MAREYGISPGDLWGTPPALLDELGAEFRFVLDCAATAEDAAAPAFIGPEQDALSLDWHAHALDLGLDLGLDELGRPGAAWCNPPYSVKAGGHLAWIGRGLDAARRGLVVVYLVGATPGSTAMQRAHVEATEIRWASRRLACLHPDTGRPTNANNTDQAVIVCTPAGGPAQVSYFEPPPGACRRADKDHRAVEWTTRKRGASCAK